MFTFTGVVIEGSKRASALGYPTVNIFLPDESVSGIYIGKVYVNKKEYSAAVFADPNRKILEAYLLDFSGDLYGKEISIQLFVKLRENKTFADDALLKEAIEADVLQVRKYFEKIP